MIIFDTLLIIFSFCISMLQIVNEVRDQDSARRVFTILHDQNTVIAPCCSHVNAPILKNKLEYEDVCEGNGLICQ